MNYTSYYSLEKTTVRLVLFSRKTKCRITSHEVAIKNVVQQNKKFTRMIQISLTQAPKRCWHLPFRDNLTSNFTYVPYAAKQGAFISADQSIMHDSADSASSQMMKTVSGCVSLRELLFYLRSTLAINAASFRTEENFNDRNFNRERELSISIVYVG